MNKWQWSSKLEHWVPANLENHRNNSTLSERLLTRGLISAKTLEQIERENRWIQWQAKHERELAAYRKRLDILVAVQKEKRAAGKRKEVGCVFCGRKETPNVYVCSECCTKLLSAGEESLRMGYLLAVWHGLEDKANALLNFLSPTVAKKVGKEVELTKDGTYSKLEVLHGPVSTHGRAAKRVRVVRDLGRKKTLPRRAPLRRAAVR